MNIDRDSEKDWVIDELSKHGNISRAAREIGFDRTTIIRWMEGDKKFRLRWEKALKKGRK